MRNFKILKKARSAREDVVSYPDQGGKSLVSSKTFWVNLLGGAVSVLTIVGSISFLPSSLAPWIAGGLAVANVLLRIITNEPITSIK